MTITKESPSLAEAEKIIDTLLEFAQKTYQKPVAIAVVDHAGILICFKAQDCLKDASPMMAIAKARTAAIFNISTNTLSKRGRNSSDFCDTFTTCMPGGVVIRDWEGNAFLGIGISGLDPIDDHKVGSCAVFDNGTILMMPSGE